MSYFVAVANLKGGVGKSTISVNLACALNNKRNTVALIDADRQETSTQYAARGLLPVDVQALPLDDVRDVNRWLNRVLPIQADYVVLDAPPHVGPITTAMLGIADLVLISCSPSTADLMATLPTVELVRAARAKNGRVTPRCLLIPSRVDRRTLSGREIEDALKRLGEPVGPAIHQRAAFVDALTAGQWIGEFAPGTDADEDIRQLAGKIRRLAL